MRDSTALQKRHALWPRTKKINLRNVGMANRQGDVDLRFAQVSAPVSTLAWLGLVQIIRSLIQAFVRSIQRSPHQETQRRTVRPRCPVDRALHRWAEIAFQQHTVLRQPPQHTTYLRLPPATLGKAQWHLPILTTEPRSATQLTVHEITLNKYCYCWSAVVVIPSSPTVYPQVYHQNIRGLRGKLSQLFKILYSELPHMICITEHHLKDFEIDMSLDIINLIPNFA